VWIGASTDSDAPASAAGWCNTRRAEMHSKPRFYGWKLVAVLFALDFLNMGFPFFGGAVINTYMLRQIPMSRSTYGLGFTLLNLFIGLPSIIVAAVILKWGARTAFVIGSALIFLGTLFLSLFASRPWQYLLAFGVVIATGISSATIVPITTVAARWFNHYRGRAMAIPLSASGFAGFLGAPLINKILAANGGNWRQAWLVVAVIAVASGIIALLFVKERPEDLGQAVDGIPQAAGMSSSSATSTAMNDHIWIPSEAYRTQSYWMVFIGGIACQFPYFFFVAHWILHLRSADIGAATAAWALGFLTMGGIAGRLIGGVLMDKIAARYAFMMGLCCYLAGSILAIEVRVNPLPIAFAAAILYGVAFGWTFVCLNAITARFYGPSAYPKLNGMMLLLTGVACAPAGIVGGLVFDKLGSYTGAFALNMALAIIGIFALSFATAPQLRRTRSLVSNHAI
jgi:MFS family permease